MVGLNPEGPARDLVMRLMHEKDKIEDEIREHTAVLETNNIGMTESLVDNEGYPRDDIDVYKVRHARHRIVCLQNDHKAIMRSIEQGLAEVHAHLMGSHREGSSSAPATTSQVHMNGHANGHANGYSHANGHANGYSHANGHANGYGNSNGHPPGAQLNRGDVADEGTQPFATVGVVESGSPADLAGLHQNDEILQFGTVHHSNFSDMTQIQNIVTHSVGQSIQVKVRRQRNIIHLSLVPRPWSQPGLLGCRINRI